MKARRGTKGTIALPNVVLDAFYSSCGRFEQPCFLSLSISVLIVRLSLTFLCIRLKVKKGNKNEKRPRETRTRDSSSERRHTMEGMDRGKEAMR